MRDSEWLASQPSTYLCSWQSSAAESCLEDSKDTRHSQNSALTIASSLLLQHAFSMVFLRLYYLRFSVLIVFYILFIVQHSFVRPAAESKLPRFRRKSRPLWPRYTTWSLPTVVLFLVHKHD